MDNQFGTAEERSAVRYALIALKEFNSKLAICSSLGIACHLKPEGKQFVADFTVTTNILPALSDEDT